MKFHYLFLLLLIGCQQEENSEVEWSFPEDLSHEYEYGFKKTYPLEHCVVIINPVPTGEYRMDYFDNTVLNLKIYGHDELFNYRFEITHFTYGVNYCSTGWAAIDDNGILILRPISKVKEICTDKFANIIDFEIFEAKNKNELTPFIFEIGFLKFKYKNTDLVGVNNRLYFKA